MATVRITNTIRADVKNKLNSLYNARIRKKEEELKHIGAAEACYQRAVPEKFRRLARELNSDPDGKWIEEANSINVRVQYPNLTNPEADRTIRVFNAPFAVPVPLPQHMRYGSTNLNEDTEPYPHAVKIMREIDAIGEERDRVIHSIVYEVLGKCTTLRQVLKLWPTALDFMPDYVRAKHAEQPEKRGKKAVEELEIDTDVKVSLMKARMLNVNQ